jgi:hypothetical protein
VFCIYLTTNSDLCHLQKKPFGFITEKKSVYSAVRTGSLNEAVYASSFKGRNPAYGRVVISPAIRRKRVLVGKSEGGDPDVDGRIMLRLIIRKWDVEGMDWV